MTRKASYPYPPTPDHIIDKMVNPKAQHRDDQAIQSVRLKQIESEFDTLITQAGHIIQMLLEEEGSEKYTVIGRVCEAINWSHKARWSYQEFAKDGKLATKAEAQ
mgnify:CR=1 FL=1